MTSCADVIVLDSVAETSPGSEWADIFATLWPGYRAWFVRGDVGARPSYLESRRMLREHMPELVPTWNALVDLAGGGDLAARFLAMWRPPPYIAACSQVVWPSEPPVLARNYDYAPRLWDAVLWRTEWTGRGVLAMTDSLWGVLDGVNDRGLAVSLAFGGRRIVGPGFGMPLILRYILETCGTTEEACAALERIPTHMAYNVTVLDEAGAFATVHTAPDRPAERTGARSCANHQPVEDWPRYLEVTESHRRGGALAEALQSGEGDIGEKLLASPLYRDDFKRGMGTLYTAVWRPDTRAVDLAWPGVALEQSLDSFTAGKTDLPLPGLDPEL